MGWTQEVVYIDDVPVTRTSTKKKFWTGTEWKDVVIWRINFTRSAEEWLRQNYGPPVRQVGMAEGWTVSFDKIIMSEAIYLFFCLKFT